jgi:hypothetical protein
MFLYGGYSKVKEPGRKSEGKVHNDMWVLNLQPLSTGGTPAWDRCVIHCNYLHFLIRKSSCLYVVVNALLPGSACYAHYQFSRTQYLLVPVSVPTVINTSCQICRFM